jgi:hypothetical protein
MDLMREFHLRPVRRLMRLVRGEGWLFHRQLKIFHLLVLEDRKEDYLNPSVSLK